MKAREVRSGTPRYPVPVAFRKQPLETFTVFNSNLVAVNTAEVDEVLHRIFVECNDGGDADQLRVHADSFLRLFSSLNPRTQEYVNRLTRSDHDKMLRDAVAEVTVVCLLASIKKNEISLRDEIVLSAEVCVAESLYQVMSYLELEFGTADLWLALIHFEVNETVEPFTTNYSSADEALRRRYIVHSCLDASLPGYSIPDEAIDYVVENIDKLVEICAMVHQRKSLSVGIMREYLNASTKGLSPGVL